MSRRKSKLSRLLTGLFALLVLALVIGAICKFTQVDDEIIDLFNPTFRVEFNGVDYTGDNNIITLTPNEQARFDVKSINGYKISVTPNVTADTDFTYTVDGVLYKYSETNLAKAFLAEDNIQAGYFTLNVLRDYSLESVLSKVYEGQTVLVDSNLVNPYLLTITSNEQKIQFVICIGVLDISFDCESIVF